MHGRHATCMHGEQQAACVRSLRVPAQEDHAAEEADEHPSQATQTLSSNCSHWLHPPSCAANARAWHAPCTLCIYSIHDLHAASHARPHTIHVQTIRGAHSCPHQAPCIKPSNARGRCASAAQSCARVQSRCASIGRCSGARAAAAASRSVSACFYGFSLHTMIHDTMIHALKHQARHHACGLAVHVLVDGQVCMS